MTDPSELQNRWRIQATTGSAFMVNLQCLQQQYLKTLNGDTICRLEAQIVFFLNQCQDMIGRFVGRFEMVACISDNTLQRLLHGTRAT